MRFLKWLSLGLSALVALAFIGVLVVVWLVDANSFKSQIESAVRDATGREFTLVGDIELGFFPWLALRTGKGEFGNAAGFGPEPMVRWESAQVGARLFPLLRGKLIADRVVLEGADVRLVRRADGSNNWQDIGARERAAAPAREEPMEIHIDGVRIVNSRLSFIDEGVPRNVEVTRFNLTTDEISPGKPLTDTEMSGVLRMDGFAPEGVPFRVDVPRLESPEDFSAIDVKEFALTFGGFEVEGGVSGTLGEKPRLQGSLETNVFAPRALLSSVGIAAPKTTDATALGKVQFTGNWRFDSGAVSLEPFSLQLDDTKFSGHFRRGAGEAAVGEFLLRGDELAIARYIPPPDPASEPFVLPTATLKALKFRGVVELEEATLDDVIMKGVVIRLLLDEQGLRSDSAQAGSTP